MRNKYLAKLQQKVANLPINENWAYDYLYGQTKPAMSGPSNYGDDVESYGPRRGGARPSSSPNEVVGRDMDKNPDGTTTITTHYANGKSRSDIAKSRADIPMIKAMHDKGPDA